MKWYIYNANNMPLYWNEDVLEFDTRDSAERFLESAIANHEYLEDFWTNAVIKADDIIVGDVLNATNLIIADADLVEVSNET